MGAERKSAYIDEKNKLLTAYHEVRWLAIDQDAPCSNLHRVATPWQHSILKVQCLCTRLHASLVVTHSVLCVTISRVAVCMVLSQLDRPLSCPKVTCFPSPKASTRR